MSSIWSEIKDFLIWVILGLGALLSYFGKREMDKVNEMRNDFIGRSEVERRLAEREKAHDKKLDTIHDRVDDIYRLLAGRNHTHHRRDDDGNN